MLEVRYIKSTGQITGWCGNERQFGNLDRGRDTEAIVILDIGIPNKPLNALLFDGKQIVNNSDYIKPIIKDAFAEIDKLKARVKKLEEK